MSQHLADTNPKKPAGLEAQLRAEEPPIYADDTPASGSTVAIDLFERLRAEEPPIAADDTSPSRVHRPMIAPQPIPPTRTPAKGLRRLMVAGLLLGATVMLAGAAYLLVNVKDDQPVTKTVQAEDGPEVSSAENAPVIIPDMEQPDRAAQFVTVTPTQTSEPVNQTAPQPTDVPASQPTPIILPTAAANEIAAALSQPVDVDPPADVIVRASAPFTIRATTNRSEIIQYTIQDGDTLDSIAAKFGLDDIYTLVWSNPRNKYMNLTPGTQLTILPEDGVYTEVTDPITIADLATQYQVTPYDIIDAEYNNLFGSLPESLLPPGMWVAVPGGQSERISFFAPVVQAPSTGSGGSGGAGAISGQYNLWGCKSNISGGTAPYGRPLQYYQWMQGFTLGGHEGVDLSGNIGDPVFAAGGGTVAYAGWNNTGYGNVVVIAHGSTFSLYAHLNGYNVSCGQSVSGGSVIGAVGSSGNSSGPHLHFEIRDANWGAHNPQNYVGF